MASVPLKQHRKAWESAWLQSTMAGAGTLLLLAVIMRDLGPTTDEFTYIECCRQVDRWVSDLPDLGTSNFTAKRLQEGWPFATTNNKSLTVPALCAWIGRSAIGRFDQPPHSWRWGNSLLFAATTGLIFYWLKVECSTRAAIVAVATLLGTPRLLANACLFSVDPIVGCFWVWCCWSLVQSSRRTGWMFPILFSVLAAGGIATKPTFWFAIPVCLVWGLVYHRRCLRPFLCLATVTPLTVLILCPMWWAAPMQSVVEYYHLLSTPRGWEGVDAYYLGDVYQMPGTPPVPWHAVIVLTVVTTPLWIGVFFFAGSFGWLRICYRSDVVGLWMASTAVPPAVVMLPQTPGHDGVRMFLTSFFFVAMVTGYGFERAVTLIGGHSTITDADKIRTSRSTATGTGVRSIAAFLALISVVGLSTWTVVRSHPAQLSYYNSLVGGWVGASQPVRQSMTSPVNPRPRHELSFWWEAMRLDDWRDMQRQLPAGSKVLVYPDYIGLALLEEWGALRSDIYFVRKPDEAEYLLIYCRLGRITSPDADPVGDMFYYSRPLWERQVNGVRMAVLCHAR